MQNAQSVSILRVENPADTSMPPGAGPYTYYIAKRGRPGWFPKAAPVRGLYFFSASSTSGSRPELRSAAGSQGRRAPEQTSCPPPSASRSSTDRVVVLRVVTNWICFTPCSRRASSACRVPWSRAARLSVVTRRVLPCCWALKDRESPSSVSTWRPGHSVPGWAGGAQAPTTPVLWWCRPARR